MDSKILGRGIGVHGGALSGVVTFSLSPDEVRKLKEREKRPVILLRRETSTDDVSLMPEIDGMVTAAGGATSHAAILAQKFDLSAIVGCAGMNILTDEQGGAFAEIGGSRFSEGMPLSIDGDAGIVYSGSCDIKVKESRY
jgi:pyruvate,orthophosphate dikinase